MYHQDLKDHIRSQRLLRRARMAQLPKEGERVPVDGLEASRVASDYLNLKPAKVIRR